MKRILFSTILGLFLFAAVPVFGQERGEPASKAEEVKPEAEAEPAERAEEAAPAKEPEQPHTVQTPFGLSTRGAAPPADTRAQDALVSVKKKGDVYEFRRRTPFGHQVWTKPEDEFNENEKRWFEASKPKPAAKPAPKK